MASQGSLFKFENSAELLVVSIDGNPWLVAADAYRTSSLALGSQSYNISKLGDDEMDYKALVSPGRPNLCEWLPNPTSTNSSCGTKHQRLRGEGRRHSLHYQCSQ